MAQPATTLHSWEEHAKRLSGESDAVREKAIRALTKMPKLEETLSKSLSEKGTQSLLALDVIAALSLKELLPLLSQLAETDRTGSIFLTINSLIDSKNVSSIVSLYLQQLEKKILPAPVTQVVILDTLARMKVPLRSELLKTLWDQDNFEIRRAVLYYARHLLKYTPSKDFRWIVEKALITPPDQLRAQAFSIVSELDGQKQ